MSWQVFLLFFKGEESLKLSIIIPVYNIENYINNCVESVIASNLYDYEIIMVDDGSLDNSGTICEQLMRKYPKCIKVLHQQNKGLSGARNTGILNARGEYVMFIDGDDMIDKSVDYSHFIEMLDSVDIIQYKWFYYYPALSKYTYFDDYKVATEQKYDEILLQEVRDGSLSVSACTKVVRRSLIIDNDLFFEDGLICEDIDWSLRLYLVGTSIKVYNKNIYMYRQQRKGSITYTNNRERIESLYAIIIRWYKYSYPNKKKQRIFVNYIAYQYLVLLSLIKKDNCDNKLKQQIYLLQDILSNNLNYKVKMANKSYKILGIKITVTLMRIYSWMKDKKLLKL